jgi:hypothetical protein
MPDIPKPIDSTNIFLCGPVSSGKTWLMQQWVNSMERSLTIDTTAAFIASSDFDHFTGEPKRLCQRLEENEHYYRIAYHPLSIKEDFEWCARAIWQLTLPRWFVVDEVQQVMGDSLSTMGTLLCQVARHNLLGFIGAAQRIADVNKGFTSSCRMVVLFQTSEVRDIIAIQDRWGREIADAVSELKPCIYDDVTKEVKQTPECLVWVRGLGHKVYSLGNKTFENTEELWQEISTQAQTQPEQSSSAPDSGQRESESSEDSSEDMKPE